MRNLFLVSFLALSIVYGCKTTADQEDGQRPTFKISFLDSQGQIIQQFDQNSSSPSSINLSEGERYSVLFVTRDPGGIQNARVTYPQMLDVIEAMPSEDPPPSTWVESASLSDKTFTWTGNATDRKDGVAYGVTFHATGSGASYLISVRAEDFGSGGISTDGNFRTGSVRMNFISD